MNKKTKTPQNSAVTMREMVMPNHTNPQGTIFGGQVMAWIDIACAMAGAKHCNGPVVTVHVDELTFLAPIKVGHHVTIKATVNFVGKTSMEIGCVVQSENVVTGEIRKTTSAYLTFVALDEFGKPRPAPELKPQTPEEKRRWENAKQRCQHRKELSKKLNNQSNS